MGSILSGIKSGLITNVASSIGSFLPNGQQIYQNLFNAKQAKINRDWQEQMSNTAYQRGVKDMQAAGLNPALMYGSAGPATTPSGSLASGSLSPIASMTDYLNAQLLQSQKEKLDAEKEKIVSETELTNLKSIEQRILNTNTDDKMKLEIDNLRKDLGLKDIEVQLKEGEITLNQAKEELTNIEKAIKEVELKYKDEMMQLMMEYQEAQTETVKQQKLKLIVDTAIAELDRTYQENTGTKPSSNSLFTGAVGFLQSMGLIDTGDSSDGKDKSFKHSPLSWLKEKFMDNHILFGKTSKKFFEKGYDFLKKTRENLSSPIGRNYVLRYSPFNKNGTTFRMPWNRKPWNK